MTDLSAHARAEEVAAHLHRYVLDSVLHGELADLRRDEPLVTAGLVDSLAVVGIAVEVENVFGVRIPDDVLTSEDFDTIDEMTAAVLRRMA